MDNILHTEFSNNTTNRFSSINDYRIDVSNWTSATEFKTL